MLKRLLVAFLAFAAPAFAGPSPSLVRLYLIPTAPVALGWDSPRALLLTTLEATLLNKSHPIGHVAIEVQRAGDPAHHAFTGASAAQPGVGRTLLLNDRLGFAILERAWPGVLETGADLAQSVKDRAKHRGRLAVATFLISDAAADRLLAYHAALASDARPRYYGFGARPRRGEGSGCSAFGASFLELAGAMDRDMRAAWTRTVRVPLELMAGYAGQTKITIARMLASKKANRWANALEPHMLLECFDPDLMFDWAMGLHADPTGAPGWTVARDPELPKLLDRRYGLDGLAAKNVKAVVIDARHVPVPAGPIFTGAPAVAPVGDSTIPTVARTDKVVGPDGSFEIRP